MTHYQLLQSVNEPRCQQSSNNLTASELTMENGITYLPPYLSQLFILARRKKKAIQMAMSEMQAITEQAVVCAYGAVFSDFAQKLVLHSPGRLNSEKRRNRSSPVRRSPLVQFMRKTNENCYPFSKNMHSYSIPPIKSVTDTKITHIVNN